MIFIVTQTYAITEAVKRLLDFPKNFGTLCQFYSTLYQDVGYLASCIAKHVSPDMIVVILEHDPGHPEYSHDDLTAADPFLCFSLDQLKKNIQPLLTRLVLNYLTPASVPMPDDGWV